MQRYDISRAEKAAELLINKLKEKSLTLALSESCTGGLASALLTDIPGASAVLWGSFVCYTKEAKVSMLNLDGGKLLTDGLVSKQTAASMAINALEKSGADLAAAVTGLAGPGGDGSDVPVGTVWVAAVKRGSVSVEREFHFTGTRNEIRIASVIEIFETVISLLV